MKKFFLVVPLLACNGDDVAENGSACVAASNCAGGTCLTELGGEGFKLDFVGGYCTNTCTAGMPWECEWEDRCLLKTSGETSGFCYQRCYFDSDCRDDEGYECTKV